MPALQNCHVQVPAGRKVAFRVDTTIHLLNRC